MSGKKLAYASPVHEAADQFLTELDLAAQEVKRLEAEAAAIMAKISPGWAEKLQTAKDEVSRLDCALKGLMKTNRKVLFPAAKLGSVSINIPRGNLLYDREEYVVKGRKVLANLLKYGFEEAIRRTAAPDWDVLADKEEWPNEVLAIIGTRRDIKETFAYEINPITKESKQ